MVRVISVHIQSKLLQLTDRDWSHPDLASAKCLHNWMNEQMFNDTPARKTDRLMGVRTR